MFKELKSEGVDLTGININAKIDSFLDRFYPIKKQEKPNLFPLAQEIASLCCLSLNNGSRGEIFSAAKLLFYGDNPPASPLDLRQYFAKGGAIYKEYPWSGNGLLKPMDIPKHWPRLSGAIIPPSVKSKSRAREEC